MRSRWRLACPALLIVALLLGFGDRSDAQVPANNRGLWDCSLDGIGTTLTECEAEPPAGLRYYITSLTAQSTTATGGLFLIRAGTGANCATGTVSVLPSAATVVRLAAPANTVAPLVITFLSPLPAPTGTALCVLGVLTHTTTITMTGFLNP